MTEPSQATAASRPGSSVSGSQSRAGAEARPDAAGPPALEVEGLCFAYEDHQALNGVDLRVQAGEIFGVLGPNGSGKSTLFRILCTLLRPDRGRARVFGEDVSSNPAAVRRKIGVVFQSPSLDGKLKVRENLMHQGHLYGMRGRRLRERSRELLERFGLADRAEDRVEVLSGGLRRRVELAKGLLHHPRLLLLDEPSTGLDPRARRDLWEALAELREEGITAVVTTHLMDEAERCHRLVLMDAGEVVASGRPEELKAAVGGDVVSFQAEAPEGLAREVEERFAVEATAVDGRVRVETEDGHELLTRVLEAFPGRIRSTTIARPSLDDVFFRRTGKLLEEEGRTP